MLTVRDLGFSYGRTPLIRGLSFSVSPGECLVLAGPNGSGKSTVLSLLAGILKPQSGSVTADGRLAYVPQKTALFEDMRVEDNLRFFAGLSGAKIPCELPLGVGGLLREKVSRLSGGTARRVSIVCALLGSPSVLLLDEPCAGLDLRWRKELFALLAQRRADGAAVVYVGHEPEEIEAVWDRLILFGGEAYPVYSKRQLSGITGDADKETILSGSTLRAILAAAAVREVSP